MCVSAGLRACIGACVCLMVGVCGGFGACVHGWHMCVCVCVLEVAAGGLFAKVMWKKTSVLL